MLTRVPLYRQCITPVLDQCADQVTLSTRLIIKGAIYWPLFDANLRGPVCGQVREYYNID